MGPKSHCKKSFKIFCEYYGYFVSDKQNLIAVIKILKLNFGLMLLQLCSSSANVRSRIFFTVSEVPQLVYEQTTGIYKSKGFDRGPRQRKFVHQQNYALSLKLRFQCQAFLIDTLAISVFFAPYLSSVFKPPVRFWSIFFYLLIHFWICVLVTRVRSQGYVTVNFRIVMKNMKALGYSVKPSDLNPMPIQASVPQLL